MKKDNEKEATRTEYDDGPCGSDWKEYEIKTIATAFKYKWKSAMYFNSAEFEPFFTVTNCTGLSDNPPVNQQK
jgi:hypothetical protein